MQTKDDGTHAILLATDHPNGRRDRVGLPVTYLRRTDGKLRRDGFILLRSRSRLLLSTSAEDCTAHWDSLLFESSMFGCAAEAFCVMTTESEHGDNDEEDRGRAADDPTD